MAQVKDVLAFLEKIAPPEMKMDFDNVGLLAGWPEKEIKKAEVALDVSDDVISEAVENGAQLIVSHHPLIFSPVKAVRADDYTGSRIISLIENGISAICMHTNLDAAEDGVNDALAKKAGIEKPEMLCTDGYLDGKPYCIGRIGNIFHGMSMPEYLPYLRMALNAAGLRFHDAGKGVDRVAVIGGSGGAELKKVIDAGADTFITADIKYDVFLEAKHYGINLIDADHFSTENTVVPPLCEKLNAAFPEVEFFVSKTHGQTADFC